MSQRKVLSRLFTSVSTLGLLTIVSPALAQTTTTGVTTQPTDQSASPTEAEQDKATLATTPAEATSPAEPQQTATNAASADIVVTGSRLSAGAFAAPTPVTAINSDQLVKSSPSTLADSLRQLPALGTTSGPQANSGTRDAGQSFLNLRALGPTRTLTLVNGRRFVAGSRNGAVDVNAIPSAIVSRVEVVTGGASAAYGSDAVAGAVNFILDDKFVGLKADAYSGVSQRGDNGEVKASVTWGTDLAGSRGHLLVSGEYFRNRAARPEDRDWSSAGRNLIGGPAGGPALIEAAGIRAVGTNGGTIVGATGGTAAARSALLSGIQFIGGQAAPYSFGSYRSGALQIGGDGIDPEHVQDLARPLERAALFAQADYDLTDGINAFFEGNIARSTVDTVGTLNRYPVGSGALTIRGDNAFLPDSVRAQMASGGVTSISVARFGIENGPVRYYNRVDTDRFLGGLRGEFGKDLKWEVSYNRGHAEQDTQVRNIDIVPRLQAAIDAVRNASGAIVCRSTLTSPGNGCVPFNIFGVGVASPEAIAYARGTSRGVTNLNQQVVAGELSGSIVDLWAGPLTFATGGEWREEKARVTVDPLSAANSFLLGNYQAWRGRYTTREGFLELGLPLLKDVAFARELSLNGAARLTNYSTSGDVWSWKAGVSYVPFEGIRFRATRSRDIRAPNLSELFNAGVSTASSPTDPFNGNVIIQAVPYIQRGNPDLRPELADTLTAGVVIQPLRGLSASVDYYDIKVNDAIQALTAQQTLDQCFSGNAAACSLTNRDASGALTSIIAAPINLSRVRVSGIDVDVAYRTRVSFLDDANLSTRLVVGYLQRLETVIPGSAPIDLAGDIGVNSTPHWTGNAQVNLDTPRFSTFLQARFIGSGKWDVTRTPAQTNFNHVEARVFLDGEIAAKVPAFGKDSQVYLNVRNILDQDPPFSPLTGIPGLATNPNLYDLIGRTFRVGVRLAF